MEVRRANERIAEKAEHLHFVSRVPMMCECSAPACQTLLMIALPDYRALRDKPSSILVAPGHLAEDAELHQEAANYHVLQAHHTFGERKGDRRSA